MLATLVTNFQKDEQNTETNGNLMLYNRGRQPFDAEWPKSSSIIGRGP